jgi:sporulation protein YlmC with PRC-barrel domain
MNPDGPIKLVSELLDLPIIDSDGKYCGIVDDVEFKGSPGKELTLKALLVGSGAYAGRLPGWAMWLVRWTVGDNLVRVPLAKVAMIKAAVHLDCAGGNLGLLKYEALVNRWIPRKGAF